MLEMYQTHWNLREKPFVSRLEPGRYFAAPAQEEALARLEYLVESQRRLGLLLGPAAAGKSLVLAVLARRLGRHGVKLARYSLAGLSAGEALWQAAVQWGLNPSLPANTFELARELGQRLWEHRWQGLRTAVLLDDGELATTEALDQVARLARAAHAAACGLTIVLACRTGEAGRLGSRLLDLAELRVEIEPWDVSDTAGYIDHALSGAGRTEAAFEPDALVRLHELAGGAVGRVLVLADLALLAAAGRKLQRVDSATVQAVHEELGISDHRTVAGELAY